MLFLKNLWHKTSALVLLGVLTLLLLLGTGVGIAASNGEILIGTTSAHTSHMAGPFAGSQIAATTGNVHIGNGGS